MINLEKDYTGEVEVDKTQSKHVRKHLAVSPPQFSSSEDMILTLLISVAATKLANQYPVRLCNAWAKTTHEATVEAFDPMPS